MTQMTLVMGFFALFPMEKVRSAGQVSADLPRHVSSWTPAAYGQPRGSTEDEKVEWLKREEQEELHSLWAVPVQRRTHQQMQRITDLLLNKWAKKKRKKRRKKKLPKTSSSRGPARRQQRQCHVAGFPGDVSPRAVFPSLSSGPRCSASWPVWTRRTRSQLVGFSLWPLVFGSHLFAVLLGSTVDTCYVSLQRLLWEIAENVPFSAQCLVRHWISEMTLWSFSYSAQCLVRQLLREMTS